MLQSLTSRQKNGKSVHTLRPGQSTHHTHTHARCYLPQSKGGTIKDLKKKGMSKCEKMAGEWLKAECPFLSSLYIYAILIQRASKPTKIWYYNLQYTTTHNSNNNQKGENLHWNAQDSFFFPILFFRSHTKKGCRSESTFTLAKVYKCTIIQLEVCIHY